MYQGTLKVSYPGVKRGSYLTGRVRFSMAIDYKAGKYRVSMTDFVHEEPRGSGGPLEANEPACGPKEMALKRWAQIKTETEREAFETIKKLKYFIGEFERTKDNDK